MFKRITTAHAGSRQASRLGLAAALAVAAFALSPLAQAADAKAGMRVFKDPITGELRAPTAAEAAALDAADAKAKAAANAGKRRAATAATAPQEFTLPNGMVGIDNDESTLSYSVVTRNADGTLDLHCVQGKQNADALVKGKKQNSKAASAAKEHGHAHQ